MRQRCSRLVKKKLLNKMHYIDVSAKFIFYSLILFYSLPFNGIREGTAAPLFYDPLTVEGRTVFRDSRQADLYYYVPGPLILKQEDGRPLFHFTRIGYLGTARTQDQGSYQNKGVISFVVHEEFSPTFIEATRSILRDRYNPAIILKRLPVDSMNATLVYEGITADGVQDSGRLVPLLSADDAPTKAEEIWSEHSFVLFLDTGNAAFFWKAFQENRLVLSLVYTLTVSGMDKKGTEIVSTRRNFSGALPIRIHPGNHPDLFEEIDLGSKMEIGYTHLDILCFDFVNNVFPRLYSKIVEIRYEDLQHKSVLSHVEFDTKKRNFKESIDFSYAKSLESPYDYRIISIDREGERHISDWQQDNSDSLLDVTTDTTKQHGNTSAENRGLL